MKLEDLIFWKIAVLLIILLTVVMFPMIAFPGSSDAQTEEGSACKDSSCIEGKWGINIVAIRLSAKGYMLDFRYKVVDPKKSLPIFDPKINPYIIDQASGAKCFVPSAPKTGSLRQKTRNPETNRDYFILFSNPGRLVKAGNKVTLVIGDFKAENLTVE